MRVVIVEDEDMIRDGLSKLICKINKNVKVVAVANNGRDGVEIISKLKPDLVITDIKMPKLDGLEMLNELDGKGIKHKTIILSAYSEFEYAQKAIKLGVSEYILKPISILSVTKAISNVEEQISNSNKLNELKNENELEIGDIFNKILFTQDINEEEIRNFFKVKYNIDINQGVGVFVLYTGIYNKSEVCNLKKRLEDSLSKRLSSEYFIIENRDKKEIILNLFNLSKINIVENALKNICNMEKEKLALGYIKSSNVINIKESLHSINEKLEWNLSINSGEIIRYDKVEEIYTTPIYYPIDIENELRNSICKMKLEELNEVLSKFISYCKKEVYSPREIKNNLIKFLWAIINITKEVNSIEESNLDIQKLLTDVMLAKTWNEIGDVFLLLFKFINESNSKNNKDNDMSLLVKRARGLVHEFYSHGITLEEISDKLNITPEYLGTQFKKEIGESFSVYIKRYRINKAKKLLIGTNFKLYQIAERVGYNDSKYFSKVFKENTSYLPLEYRKLYK